MDSFETSGQKAPHVNAFAWRLRINMSSTRLHEYWESRLGRDFNLEGVGYLGLGEQYNAWLYRVRRRVFLRVARNLDLDFANSRVLDVGSGTGFYVAVWQELGVRDLVGVDITQTARQQLQLRFPEYRFYTANIGQSIVWPDCDFDVISAIDVLFHIVDETEYSQAVLNLSALLKPGGLLILSENFLHGEPRSTVHQVSRTLATIERLLASSGFDVVKRAPLQYLMNAPVDSNSSVRRLLWRSIRFITSRSELAGFAVGAVLFPLELLLVSLLPESPTTEIMVCKRRS